MFQLLNAGQFILAALELNGDAHLAAGITTAHVAAATLYETRRIWRSELLNQTLGALSKIELLAPMEKSILPEHKPYFLW